MVTGPQALHSKPPQTIGAINQNSAHSKSFAKKSTRVIN